MDTAGAPLARKNSDKYRAIIEAAIRVFGEFGYHQARVAQVAREAGVAEGTVYLYFRNKEDLLVSAFREVMEHFTASVERELASVRGPVAARLRRVVEMHFASLGEDYTLALFLQIHLRQPENRIREAIAPPLARYARIIQDLLREGMASGEFLPGQDVRLLRQMVFGAMDEVVSNWVRAGGKYSLPQQVPAVFTFLLRALTGKP